MNQINFFFEDIEHFTFNSLLIQKSVAYLIQNEQKQNGELSVIFCSDSYLYEMNLKHLKHNTFTDIITFDYSDGLIISGDLFISKERVAKNAKKYNTDFFNELYRVIFHGVLHLVGYGDKKPGEKIIMTEKENYYLEYLYKKVIKNDAKI